MFVCPNTNCTNKFAGKKGKYCPECGKEFKKLTVRECKDVFSEKDKIRTPDDIKKNYNVKKAKKKKEEKKARKRGGSMAGLIDGFVLITNAQMMIRVMKVKFAPHVRLNLNGLLWMTSLNSVLPKKKSERRIMKDFRNFFHQI